MTPGYRLKHWWRSERATGESLKAFARRWAGPFRAGQLTTAAAWLQRKGKGPLAR